MHFISRRRFRPANKTSRPRGLLPRAALTHTCSSSVFFIHLLFARRQMHTQSFSLRRLLQIDPAAQKNALASCSRFFASHFPVGVRCAILLIWAIFHRPFVSAAICCARPLNWKYRRAVRRDRIYLATDERTDADLFFVSLVRSFVHLSQIA
jgi:hypothetical protein